MKDHAQQEFLQEVDGNPVVMICKDILALVWIVGLFAIGYKAILEAVLAYSLRY